MNFWLGLIKANWLEKTDVPSMMSYRTLARLKVHLPRARGSWFQDSAGFTELSLNGHFVTPSRDYAIRSRRHFDEIGNLDHIAIQDWMCEEMVLAKTGLSVRQHQERTLQSLMDLQEIEPDLPWVPVLQGFEADDYLRHVEMYDQAGYDLRTFPLVGLGTVCRRQHTMVAVRLVRDLAYLGLKLHGFGLKITSVLRLRGLLFSSDSTSWSLDGRYPQGGRCSRVRDHKQCANCLDYALLWRRRLLDRLSQQMLPGLV